MEKDLKTIGFDGQDEIVFSQSFNVFENELLIDFFDNKFKFIFEKTEPIETNPDVTVRWSDDIAVITLNKKFRNSLGSGTTEKLAVLELPSKKKVLLSVFGHQVGNSNLLHVTVNFYKR